MVELGEYLIRLSACTAAVCVMGALLPSGGVSKTAKTLMGAAIAVTALSPLIELISRL